MLRFSCLGQRVDLKDLQDEARQRIQKGAKVKVANDFEVQDPRSPAHWSAIIADCGRVFRPLDGDENIPGKEYVSMYFPPHTDWQVGHA